MEFGGLGDRETIGELKVGYVPRNIGGGMRLKVKGLGKRQVGRGWLDNARRGGAAHSSFVNSHLLEIHIATLTQGHLEADYEYTPGWSYM